MESISRLRSLLLNALDPRGLQKDEQELFDELMLHKSCLLSLLDVGPRSAQEQNELQSGEYHLYLFTCRGHLRCLD
jgi:nuclear pore complex protein Nup205